MQKKPNRLQRKTFDFTDLSIFTMRLEDVEECHAASGLSPEDAVIESVLASKFCWSLIDSYTGRCVAIYGLSESRDDAQIGIPWSLYGVGIKRVSKGVTRLIKEDSDRLLKDYTFFHNMIWAENLSAIKWLGILGYTIDFSKKINLNGETFFYFFKINDGGNKDV